MNKTEQYTLLMKQGKLKEAEKIFHAVLNKGSDEEIYALAEELTHLGFLEEALTLYQRLLDRYPDEGELLVAVAEVFIQLDREDEALSTLEKINAEDPFYAQALLLQADLYDSQGLFEVSIQKLLQAEKIAPDEPVIQFALAELYASIGKFAEAIYKYEQLLKDTKEIGHVNLHQRLADAYAAAGEFEKALHHYDHVLEDKLDIDVLFGYGLTAYQAGLYEKAIEKLTEVKELDPDYHSLYLPLAKSYEHLEDLEKALQISTAGLKVNPYQRELHYFAGKISLKLGDESSAEKFFLDAIELDPSYIDALLTLNKLYLKQERYQEIIQLVEPLLAEGEEDPDLLWDYAVSCDKEEQYSEALNAYRSAYRYLKENSDFLQNYGFFLLEEGIFDEAIEVFNKLQNMDPMNAEYLDVLERLEADSK
jgi:tetratricopeptide (TPR) repeat protein